jgi:hypothetical protein
VPSGLDPETIAQLVRRHGSLDAAWDRAAGDPRFAADFRVVIWKQTLAATAEENRAATAEGWQLVAAWDRLDEERVVGSGASLPLALIEAALHRHRRDGLGRRRLAAAVPGLTEWTAGQVLRWYGVGEPDGLWLDGEGRVQVGAKLAPTDGDVRLPRI